jgi:hypothetical protein
MAGRGCDWVGAVWRRLGLGPAAGRAAAPPSLILPLSRRSAAATWPSWPGRSAAVADSAVPSEQASATSQCTLHSCTVRDRRRKCRIDSIEIYSRVLNSKLRSRSWVRPQVRPAVGCAAVAPLCRCIAGGSAAAGAAATGISLGRAGRVAAPPSRSLIRPLRLGRAAVAAAAAAPRRLETAQRLAARHASGV